MTTTTATRLPAILILGAALLAACGATRETTVHAAVPLTPAPADTPSVPGSVVFTSERFDLGLGMTGTADVFVSATVSWDGPDDEPVAGRVVLLGGLFGAHDIHVQRQQRLLTVEDAGRRPVVMLVDRVDTAMVALQAESFLDPDHATYRDGPSTGKHILLLQPAEGLTWGDVGSPHDVAITIEPSSVERLRALRELEHAAPPGA